MSGTLDPETVDLASVAAHLRAHVGPRLEGAVVGRTHLRDEVLRHLGCSQLEAETLVDTMVMRGFLVQETRADGLVEWRISTS